MQLPIIIKGHVGLGVWGWPVHAANTKPPINIRGETAHEKRSFAHAWSRNQHCLIPANGFYEWDVRGQPFYVQNHDAPLIAFKGLWIKNTNNRVCFGILTQNATHALSPIHPRMPIIETPDGKNVDNALMPQPVNRLVNNISNNSAALIEPIITIAQGNLFVS